jgi:hypothetical protein
MSPVAGSLPPVRRVEHDTQGNKALLPLSHCPGACSNKRCPALPVLAGMIYCLQQLLSEVPGTQHSVVCLLPAGELNRGPEAQSMGTLSMEQSPLAPLPLPWCLFK